jgi:hypothetical protein
VIPNYTPKDWAFEADIWAITRAGYTREYEIKISKKDFMKDAEKCVVTGPKGRKYSQKILKKYPGSTSLIKDYKYAKLEKGEGPSYFWYITPEGVIPEELIPEWAGWIEARKRGKSIIFIRRREARKLHGRKVGLNLDQEVLTTFYWRYWTEAEKRHNVYERRDKLGRKKK